MNELKNLKKFVNVNIAFFKPKKLEQLAKKFKHSDSFPDLQSSFEFPPKDMTLIIELLLHKEYTKLNFFDIARLLTQLDNDKLNKYISGIAEKYAFTESIQELFNKNKDKKYIQNIILKVVTKIFISKNENSFKEALESSLISEEFRFVGFCVNKDFKSVQKFIGNKDFQKELKKLNIYNILTDWDILYSDMLLMQLYSITIREDTLDCYKNNLLLENNRIDLHIKIDKLVKLLEKKQNKNEGYLDEILLDKLGDIENQDSNWYRQSVPNEIMERYKQLKGLFEFKRFEKIAEFLAEYSDLSDTNDDTRILNRSAFWSNYDEKFSSVRMWVSQKDYEDIEYYLPKLTKSLNILNHIDNEVCMLEFKKNDLLIIIFFRNGKGDRYKSLIFENNIIGDVKELLEDDFTKVTYQKLLDLANYEINEKVYIWQGWVDEFLRKKRVFPNNLILEGKQKFISAQKPSARYDTYRKERGLENSRNNALKKNIEENKIGRFASLYENVILNR